MLKQHPFSRNIKDLYNIFSSLFVKRLLDIFLSLLFIVLCIPIGCIIYWKINSDMGKPVFKKQLHVGQNGNQFTRLQFRTHANTSSVIRRFPPQPVSKIWKKGVPEDVAFTRETIGVMSQAGIIIRKYHLHHLPEFLNVLKGDMSLVGPRPELMEIAAHYNNEQRKKLLRKPGIMGLAQLKGYTYEQYKKMITQDLLYVDEQSLWFDTKIIIHTIINYPNRYQKNHETGTTCNRSIGE